MASELASALVSIAARHAPPEVATWLAAGVPREGAAFARGVFFGYFAGVGRRTRGVALSLSSDERTALERLAVHAPEHWSLAELARAGLLLSACDVVPKADHVALVREAYAKGDNDERIAVLKTLSLLPDPARFSTIGEESCRTHVLDVFRAIACDNPYPAQWFSDTSWNQLVVKTMFVELPVGQVLGLAKRYNAELRRMAQDYEAERRAAGRVVSADVTLIAHGMETTQ